jgi:hypothetical protein
MVPAVDRAWTGMLDRRRKRALVLAGDLETSMWAVRVSHANAYVYSLTSWGDLELEVQDVAGDLPDGARSFRVWLGDEKRRLWVERFDIAIDYYFELDDDGRHDVGLLGATEERPVPDAFPFDEPSIEIDAQEHGDDAAEGATIAMRWPEPARDRLPKRLRDTRLHASPQPDVFVSIRASGNVSMVEHVDQRTGTVTLLDEVGGELHVGWAGDGTVLLEASEGLRRYRPPRFAPEPALDGVHLATPAFPEGEGGA